MRHGDACPDVGGRLLPTPSADSADGAFPDVGGRPVCPVCLGIVGAADTCSTAERVGVTRYGRDVFGQVTTPVHRCRGCGVRAAAVHHPFCCVAGCDTCGEQRLLCPCDDDIEPV